jgi:hypothetical protein
MRRYETLNGLVFLCSIECCTDVYKGSYSKINLTFVEGSLFKHVSCGAADLNTQERPQK